MIERVREFFRTFLLFELVKGMMLTGRHLFERKITVQYPEEKTPQSARFRGLHALRRYPNSATTAPAARRAMTSTSPSAYSADSARNPARWIRSSRRAFSNTTAKSA